MVIVYTVEPPSKGHFGTNINSRHLSFIEGLSLFGGTIHYASHKKLTEVLSPVERYLIQRPLARGSFKRGSTVFTITSVA